MRLEQRQPYTGAASAQVEELRREAQLTSVSDHAMQFQNARPAAHSWSRFSVLWVNNAFWEFSTATLRYKNTHLAYLIVVSRFAGRRESKGLALAHVESISRGGVRGAAHPGHAPTTVKQHLAAFRMLFE